MHDTGSILADKDSQKRLRILFAVRWDDAVDGPGAFEGFVRAIKKLRLHADRRDERIYRYLINKMRDVKRKMLGQSTMRIPLTPQAIPNAEVKSVAVAHTLPDQIPGGPRGGATDILRCYERVLDSSGSPDTLVYIENQYFDHLGLAEKLLKRYLKEKGPREGPWAHVVIPYKPDTHWADRWLNPFSEWERIVEDEFRHLRWCEIRSMTELLEEDQNGIWRPTHIIPSPDCVKIQDGAHDDPDSLETDTKVVFTDIQDMAGNRVARLEKEVSEFMTRGGIVTYTLALDDAGNPTGSDAQDRQRAYLEDHGIYLHSKAAVFLNHGNSKLTVATVGSANLSERSLNDNGDQDTESNVFWRQHDKIVEFFEDLVGEHTGGVVDSFSIEQAGLDALNAIRSGNGPGRHLVRLDLADRYEHF